MGYDNTNKGVLFKNDKKETDNHPDYNGSINIDGTEYWLNAWINKDKNGKNYMSLSRGAAKDNQGGSSTSQGTNNKADDFEEDDIPF